MRQLFRILMAVTTALLLTIISSYVFRALAQPDPAPQRATSPHQFEMTSPSMVKLSASSVYTLYFPLILVPPPPNPKKGVGMATGPACSDLQQLNGSWYFNWGITPDPSCSPTQAEKFVPRITGAASMNALAQAVENAKASGWLIGFSEPNLPWQTNISPKNGAIYWRQIEGAALPEGIKLVSPSPNQYEPGQSDPYGHQWTWEMVRQYQLLYGSRPHFDAIGWNIYKRNPAETKQFLYARRNEALARGYNVPFWITEYGGECWWSGHNNRTVMKEVTTWFNQTEWIQRYAWFANRIGSNHPTWQSCSLLNPSTSSLTSLGQLYVSY